MLFSCQFSGIKNALQKRDGCIHPLIRCGQALLQLSHQPLSRLACVKLCAALALGVVEAGLQGVEVGRQHNTEPPQ